MNERIREIADVSGINIWYDEDSGQEVYSGESLQVLAKFTELIVRECAIIADNWVDDADNGQNYPSEVFKKHFGVE